MMIEIDAEQHFEDKHKQRVQQRDAELKKRNLKMLHFNNLDVLTSADNVWEVIYHELQNV